MPTGCERHELTYCATCDGTAEPLERTVPERWQTVRPDTFLDAFRSSLTPERDKPEAFQHRPHPMYDRQGPRPTWSDPAVSHYGRVSDPRKRRYGKGHKPQPRPQRTYTSAVEVAREANRELAERLGVTL